RAELLERAELNVHARCTKHRSVDVAGAGVGDLLVELAAALVERAELRLVPRERTAAAAAALPRRCRLDLEPYPERALAEVGPDRYGLHRSAAECDHGRVRQAQRRERAALLLQAERPLPVPLEELRDRSAEVVLELAVEIDERPAQTRGHLGPERGLARAHEADEREVPA